jgi:hypothetical protein
MEIFWVFCVAYSSLFSSGHGTRNTFHHCLSSIPSGMQICFLGYTCALTLCWSFDRRQQLCRWPVNSLGLDCVGPAASLKPHEKKHWRNYVEIGSFQIFATVKRACKLMALPHYHFFLTRTLKSTWSVGAFWVQMSNNQQFWWEKVTKQINEPKRSEASISPLFLFRCIFSQNQESVTLHEYITWHPFNY